jgi:hypothetical protein
VRLAARSEAKDDKENHEGELRMTSRVPMVSLEHARELGEAMGGPGTWPQPRRVEHEDPPGRPGWTQSWRRSSVTRRRSSTRR